MKKTQAKRYKLNTGGLVLAEIDPVVASPFVDGKGVFGNAPKAWFFALQQLKAQKPFVEKVTILFDLRSQHAGLI